MERMGMDVDTVFHEPIEDKSLSVYFDINKISKEDLDSQYIALSEHITYISPSNLLSNKSKLKEERQYGVSIDEVKKAISQKHNLKSFQVQTGAHNIDAIIIIPNISNNKDVIDNDMRDLGYFNAHYYYFVDSQNREWLVLRYEPYYQKNETHEIIRNNDILIHITTEDNLPSILENGLVPSCKNDVFYYPDRIYFLVGTLSLSDIEKMVYNLDKAKKTPNIDKYVILIIKTSKIPSDVNLYYDMNHSYGIFTEQPIPKEAIIKKIPIENIF